MTSSPQRIAIVGGHGKVALQLIPQLLDRGKEVVALARRDEQLKALDRIGAIARKLDIENSDETEFADAFASCDAVVFSAGGGADGNIERKRTVDLEGSLKSIAGARVAGIERFVQVSAIGVDRAVSGDRGEAWAAYVAAKREADRALRETTLGWTILRPGGLTDEAGRAKVTLAEEVERGSIPRHDVAAVIAEVLDRPDTAGHQWELVGGDVPIPEAVTRAISE